MSILGLSIGVDLILVILFVHYVFDWRFQTRWMAENKSSRLDALGLHVLIYFIGLLIIAAFTPLSITWALVNAILHFGVDFCSSKISRKAWLHHDKKRFWNTIGFDQFCHYAILFLTIGL